MSNRSYLKSISINDYNIIKDYNEEEILKFYNVEDLFEVPMNKFKIIFEFGSYSETDKFFLNNCNKIFKTSLMKEYNTREVTKLDLKKFLTLESMQEASYYNDLLKNNKIDKIKNNIKQRAFEWEHSILNQNEDSIHLIDSELIDYNLIELNYISKTFDFNENKLIFCNY